MGTGDEERLRQELLDEICAGAFSGTPVMLLDEDEIREAGSEELRQIARRYGRVRYSYGSSGLEAIPSGHGPYTLGTCSMCSGRGQRWPIFEKRSCLI